MGAALRACLGALALAVTGAASAATPPAPAAVPPAPGMVLVPGADYRPFYPAKDEGPRAVPAFWMDARPVTNAQMLDFVRDDPRWRRSKASRLFADPSYLAHWAGDLELGPQAGPAQAVTYVSWFAANAYCKARGARLPTEAEWELAAQADETRRDARGDPEYTRRILSWYARPGATTMREVGQQAPNVYGLHDLHGLVWEWVQDFNASLVSADNRQEGDRETGRFCGGAAIGAADSSDYAAFMRFAFRSSLQGSYAVRNLGFRCVIEAADGGREVRR